MSRMHVRPSDAGLTPRSVTRRDALRILMGAGLVAALSPAVARAATTQEKLDAAQLSYDEAQAELERIGEEYEQIAAQVSATQVQIGEVSTQIDETQSGIDDKQAQIDDTQDQIEYTQRSIAGKQELLGERMSAAYKAGNQSTLDLILSSATFEELTSNIYYLDKVSEAERAVIEEVKSLKAELEGQKAELEGQKAELEGQKAELEGQKADLEELQAQQRSELEDARAKQEESQELVESLSAEVQELMAQRDAELLAAQKAAEEARRREEEAKKQNQGSGGGVTVVTGSGSLADVISACHSTPSPGSGLCAAWVTDVFQNAGVGSFWGNADDMYYSWCGTSTSNIQPGMIIAVNSSPTSNAGRIYGHIGIYVGNNTVMHNIGYVASYSLSQWISTYGPLCTPLCGWLGGIKLS